MRSLNAFNQRKRMDVYINNWGLARDADAVEDVERTSSVTEDERASHEREPIPRAFTARTNTLLTVDSDAFDERDHRGQRYCAWKTVRMLPNKENFLEQQSMRDLLALGAATDPIVREDGSSNAPSKSIDFLVMMNLECGFRPVDVVRAMLDEAARRGRLMDENIAAVLAPVDSEDAGRAFRQAFYTKHDGVKSVVVPYESRTISRRTVLVARLGRAMVDFDESYDSVEDSIDDGAPSFIIIVFASEGETPTKNVYATSHTLASLMGSAFVKRALDCDDETEFRRAVLDYVRDSITPTVAFDCDLSKIRLPSRMTPGQGIISDIKRRWPSYAADWLDAFRDKSTMVRCASTTIWIATTTFIPALALGLSMQSQSSRRMTHVDFLLSEALSNVAWTLIGGQSLLILRVTGPTKTFLTILTYWADALPVDFVRFSSLVSIYAGIMVMLFATFNGAELALAINRFTSENLALFISVTFVFAGFDAIATMKAKIGDDDAKFLKYFILHLGTVILAFKILEFRKSASVRKTVRLIVADFAPLMAVTAITGLSYAFPNVAVDRVNAAAEHLPRWPTAVDLALSAQHCALALVPALMFAVQIILETNICAMLVARPENKLRKGTAFNWDMFLIGGFTVATACFGLPPSVPALPHSHLHAKLLGNSVESKRHGIIRSRVHGATETRVTNFAAHVITFIVVVCFRSTFGHIPIASLSGFLVYMGLASLGANQLVRRLPGFGSIVPTKFLRRVPKRIIYAYTAVQLLVFGAIFACRMSASRAPAFAATYPAILALSVPFSFIALPRMLGSYFAHVLTTSAEEENIVGLFY